MVAAAAAAVGNPSPLFGPWKVKQFIDYKTVFALQFRPINIYYESLSPIGPIQNKC